MVAIAGNPAMRGSFSLSPWLSAGWSATRCRGRAEGESGRERARHAGSLLLSSFGIRTSGWLVNEWFVIAIKNGRLQGLALQRPFGCGGWI